MSKISKIVSIIVILALAAVEFGLAYATVKSINSGGKPDMQQGMNMSGGSVSYSAKTEISESSDVSDEAYFSETADENAVLIKGASVTMSGITVTKSGDSDGGDNTSFYGTNSAVIAKDGAELTVKDAKITTDATGANGVFSYGGSAVTNNSSSDGTTVNISDSVITTSKDNSGGIMTTGGGTMNAYDLTVNTAGTSSAAIRSDRGGGTVNVDGGSYTTTGQGSPSIYSTADITVKNAKLTAMALEGIVIEGKNSVSIDSCELIDSNTKLNGQSTTYKNIFLYQSMSGDADSGTASFTAKNSRITTEKGDTLYVTNTAAVITLENNTIANNDPTGYFLRVQKDSWGNDGSNGGTVELNMTNQSAEGDIYVDSISSLTVSMSDGSRYEGAINSDNCAGSVSLKLDSSSKLKLTADTYLTSLDDEDPTLGNIDFNGYKLYVNSQEVTAE